MKDTDKGRIFALRHLSAQNYYNDIMELVEWAETENNRVKTVKIVKVAERMLYKRMGWE